MLPLRSPLGPLTALLLLAVAANATAQEGFALDRYSPAERGSDWHANDSLDLRGHLRPAAGLVFDYAHQPLVAYGADGQVARAVVETQFFAHLGGALILAERLRLGLNVPLLLQSSGEPVVTADGRFATEGGVALGDPRLSGDVRVLGRYERAFSLAVGIEAFLPLGSQDAYASDGTLRLLPRLLAAGDVGPLAYAARLGVHVRPHDARFADTELGHELAFAAAAGLRLAGGDLLLGPELIGSKRLSGGAASTPVELLLGGKVTLADDFRLGLAGGPGLTQGFGSPDVRVVASLEWFPAVTAERDRDGDGVVDPEDRCPGRPAGATPDPARPGCPAADGDGDGIADPLDACPEAPGVADADPARHGCPAAPPPAPRPPPDSDGDGIPDPDDACPLEPGVRQETPATNGCPRARLEAETGQIRILQRIEFEYKKANLTFASVPVLEAVAAILREHPELTKVEIQGHTDDIGPDDYNLELSRARASSVVIWLVAHGIAGTRLTSVGYGETRPLDPNDTEVGRQVNRRVEFHILESVPSVPPAGGSESHTPPPTGAAPTGTTAPATGDPAAPLAPNAPAANPDEPARGLDR